MKTMIGKILIVITFWCSLAISAHAGDNNVVQLQIDGMVSATCPVLLKSAVQKIAGVKRVDASLENNTATIEFDANLTSLRNIRDVIEQQAGFGTHLTN